MPTFLHILLFTFFSMSNPEIIDLPSFRDIPSQLNSVIFFDIDETIIIPNTSFIYGINSTDNFVLYLSKTLSPSLFNAYQTLFELSYYTAPVRLVEGQITLQTLSKLLDSGNHVHGLTARDFNGQYTPILFEHLKNLGVEFSAVDPALKSFPNKDGIIFANNTNKGEVMVYYWKQFYKGWEGMALVDDSMSKCKGAQEVLRDAGLGGVSTIYHYTAAQGLISYKDMLYQFANLTGVLMNSSS